ncbi:MAG: hypothetical protein AMK75_07750 [Planctomycetes bacterium SM23_65]|nr:MAG: hypothetical protein AMK75_07750 [Planctomycetes bacterium SM23_65]
MFRKSRRPSRSNPLLPKSRRPSRSNPRRCTSSPQRLSRRRPRRPSKRNRRSRALLGRRGLRSRSRRRLTRLHRQPPAPPRRKRPPTDWLLSGSWAPVSHTRSTTRSPRCVGGFNCC